MVIGGAPRAVTRGRAGWRKGWRRRRPRSGHRLHANALTETSNTGFREHREPPEAERAAWRPVVKTLPSAGRNGTCLARCLMPRRPAPVIGQNEAAEVPHPGGEGVVAPRVPFSPTLPRAATTRLGEA